MKQILIVQTRKADVRDAIDGWTCEDPYIHVVGRAVGYTGHPKCPSYNNVLDALASGWELLSAPTLVESKGWPDMYEWWLTKERT
jgi:hypothetical protein